MGCGESSDHGLAADPGAQIPPLKQVLHYEHLGLLKKAGLKQAEAFWGGPTISKNDTLLIIDMQNDFLPADVARDGGRFGVPEGGSCVGSIVKLIEKFSEVNAQIVATRDYHPRDHSSFSGQGGPFPPHCVQGCRGSFFYPPIAKALTKAQKKSDLVRKRKSNFGEKDPAKENFPKAPDGVVICFKGFVEEFDSFGAFKYDESYYKERVPFCPWKPGDEASSSSAAWSTMTSMMGVEGQACMSCAGSWTGCFCLKCSSLAEDVNAPPDVMAITRPDKKTLDQAISKENGGKLLVVGLCYDYCVLDTAVNARKLGYEKVFIASEATRAAYIPGVGKHGSGFLTDPDFLVGKFTEHNIKVVSVRDVLGLEAPLPVIKPVNNATE